MANEPMPWQLTVAELRRALEAASQDAVVVLKVPKGGIGHPDLDVLLNLAVHRSGDPIVLLVPRDRPAAQNAGSSPNTSLERTRER
jgi:hypothetical protein